ncbi:MAG: TMEM175 family protein [Gaiellaceae bacterium]
MNTARLETFADGVFAIAATLLILNVDTGVGSGSRDLGARLLHIWPSYVGYGVSFLTIGIMWANHHMLMNQIGRVDRRFMMLTVGLLLCIAFVPFPTRLVAEHIRDDGARAAALAYGATMTAASIMFLSVWLYASRGMRLLREDADLRAVRGITRSYVPGTPVYLGSTLIAFASPTASVVLFAAIAVFYLIESSVFGGRRAPADQRDS